MGKGKKLWTEKGKRRFNIRALITKHGGRCVACKELVILTEDAPKQATIDHIIPKSLGGQDILSNMQLMCKQCNGNKGDSIPAS
jgi:5-methylcytosine-specific restriction endonuclease McrA